MKRNYITDQCCSVDDLRCHLHNYNPETTQGKLNYIIDLGDAIEHEQSQTTPRVTIVKMLTAKMNSINKSIK